MFYSDNIFFRELNKLEIASHFINHNSSSYIFKLGTIS